MKELFSNKKQEKGQGLVEYALILVLVAIVVIGALMILGPIIGNTFSTVNKSLTNVTGSSANIAYVNYQASPRIGGPSAIQTFCSTAGSGAAYNWWSVGSGWDVAAGPGVPSSAINGGINTFQQTGNCP
jgi:pilus assembly protein Flp/PilA